MKQLANNIVKVATRTLKSCDWCGSGRNPDIGGYNQLFEFGTQSPMLRVSWHRGVFCCKTCHDNYHH